MTIPEASGGQPSEEQLKPAPLRLLPWTTPEGKPVYLSSGGGMLAQMADAIEDFHLGAAEQLLALAPAILDDPQTGRDELRFVARELGASLAAVLRVAVTWKAGSERRGC
jgi:hypothetical protein